MLANFFAKSKPSTFIILLIFFALFFFLASFSGVLDTFYAKNNFLSLLFYGVLVLLTFFFFNFILRKNNLTFDNSYAFLFFILLLGSIPYSFSSNNTLLVNLLLLLFLRKVYSLYSTKNSIQKLFDAGFWLGISFLIEPFSAVFLLLLYFAVYSYQKITIQTILIPLIGIIAPLFLYFTYCFWNDDTADFYNLFYWTSKYDFSTYNTLPFLIPLVLISLFLLASAVIKSIKLTGVKNTFKKNWIVVLLNLTLALIMVVLVNNKNGSEWLYTFLPVSIVLTNGLEMLQKTWIKDMLIGFFLIVSVAVYFI